MSNLTILALAFFSVLLFISLPDSSSAQDRAKEKATTYKGKTASEWADFLKTSKTRKGKWAAASGLGKTPVLDSPVP